MNRLLWEWSLVERYFTSVIRFGNPGDLRSGETGSVELPRTPNYDEYAQKKGESHQPANKAIHNGQRYLSRIRAGKRDRPGCLGRVT